MLTYHDDGREVSLGDAVKFYRWPAPFGGTEWAKVTALHVEGGPRGVTLTSHKSRRSRRWKADERNDRLPWQIKFLGRGLVAAGDAFLGSPERRTANAYWHDPQHWNSYWAEFTDGDSERRRRMSQRDPIWFLMFLHDAGLLHPRAGAGRALEAGCGISLTSNLLAHMGWEVTAVDLAAPVIAHATSRQPQEEDLAACLNWHLTAEPNGMMHLLRGSEARELFASLARLGGSCNFRCGDWFDRELLEPSSFDLIASFHTLRFSTEDMWKRTLARFHELLAPGGVLRLENMNVLELEEAVPPLARAAGFTLLQRDERPNDPSLRYASIIWPTG